MGKHYHITCRNKACRYNVEVRDGPGMRVFVWIKTMEKEIKSGHKKAPNDIIDLLNTGHDLDCVANYLCPTCQEWQVGYFPYVFEKIHVSPYGTIREYKVHYLDGNPKCEKCGSELTFILNPCSGKNRCPKCGIDNMKVSSPGFYD